MFNNAIPNIVVFLCLIALSMLLINIEVLSLISLILAILLGSLTIYRMATSKIITF